MHAVHAYAVLSDLPCNVQPPCIQVPARDGPLLILHTRLQAHPQARSCLLLCTVSEDAHAGQPATMLGDDAYTTYAAALREVAPSPWGAAPALLWQRCSMQGAGPRAACSA